MKAIRISETDHVWDPTVDVSIDNRPDEAAMKRIRQIVPPLFVSYDVIDLKTFESTNSLVIGARPILASPK